jgi:hypothetical protein
MSLPEVEGGAILCVCVCVCVCGGVWVWVSICITAQIRTP